MKTGNLVSIAIASCALIAACGNDNNGSVTAPSSTGGANTGGANAGGANTGGANTGGANTGGANTGGANTGGANTGGANTGGANTGGANTGGANTGGANTGGANTGGADTGGANTGGANTGGANTGGANTGGANTGGTGVGGSSADPHGFVIRTPGSHTVTCGEFGVQTFSDADVICTFNHGGVRAFVYVQLTFVGCEQTAWNPPVYSTERAEISVNGQVQSLQSAAYDTGGNHRNDSLAIVYDGVTYNYYHSSFGFGWRACHDMDCLQVMAGTGGAVTEDGCTKDRTSPQVCSLIKSDGTYDDLSVDPFAWCPGDPNHS